MSGWLDRHALKLLVVAVALLICVPTALVYKYLTKVDEVAQGAAQQQQQLDANVEEIDALTARVNSKVDSLQSAIVESCRQNGNQRAAVARETLLEEKYDAEHPDAEVIAALNLPPEKIEALIAETVEKLEDRLDRVKLTPCASQYRISPGSGERRRKR